MVYIKCDTPYCDITVLSTHVTKEEESGQLTWIIIQINADINHQQDKVRYPTVMIDVDIWGNNICFQL